MSRLIIKNIDGFTDVSYLRKLFSLYGNVTDVKTFKNHLGHPKNYCFVGFDKIESAERAAEILNGTYIQNKKITIERALPKKNNFLIKNQNLKRQDNSDKILSKSFPLIDLDENVMENGSLCVQNIHATCKISDLEMIFQNFGYFGTIVLSKSQFPKTISKNAYIKFGLPEHAIKAAACLDGKIFQGKILRIVQYYSKRHSICRENFTFSEYTKIKKKFIFEHFNNYKTWFLLFIPEILIFRNLVSKYGKENDLLAHYQQLKINYGHNMITESRIQNEAFVILKREGLNLNAFDPIQMKYRSRKIVLIKNIHIEKKKTFDVITSNGKQILRYVILPLAGMILIEFKTKNDAMEAYSEFEKLSNENKYFLVQWAPLNCLWNNIKDKNYSNLFGTKNYQIPEFDSRTKKKEQFVNPFRQPDAKQTKEKNSFKLLIRNIPFSITLKAIKKLFVDFVDLLSIRLPKKKDGCSRGFCFVEFRTLEATKKAFLVIQNTHLERRRLSCSFL